MNTEENNNHDNRRDLHGDNRHKPLEEELFFRPLTRPLARYLSHTKVHPDHLSFLGFLLTLFVAWGIAMGRSPLSIVILLFFCFFFDKIDGDLARAKNIAGRKGQYIDGFLDALSDIALVGGFIYVTHTPLVLSLLAITAPLVFVYHGVSAPFYLDLDPKTHTHDTTTLRRRALGILHYGRAKLFILAMISIAIGMPELMIYILPLLTLYTILIFLKNIFIAKHTHRV